MKHRSKYLHLSGLLAAATLIGTSLTAPAQTATPYIWENVKIVAGGFITGIVPDPSTPGRMYLRTDIGGAYRYDAHVANPGWTPITDIFNQNDWNLGGTESIAIDPVDPSRIYLAQGEYTETWATNGAILRSTDAGHTFTRVNLPIQLGSNEPGRYSGERLAVDPQHHGTIYFGSRNNGLWKSTDFGATWAQVGNFPVTGPTSGVGVIFEDFQPTSATTETIYVGVSQTTTGLYQSTDGGKTWSAVAGQLTGYYPTNQVLSPDGNLYITYGLGGTGAAGMGGSSMYGGAVYKFNTTTGAWTNITPLGPWWDPQSGLWYGFGAVAVDRQHPSTVMVTTLNRWWPGDEVYRSLDGGNTWVALGNEPSGSEPGPLNNYSDSDDSLSPYLSGLASPSNCTPGIGCNTSAGSFGWWMGALAIDPFDSNHVLYGTGATLWATDDVTNADWDQTTTSNNYKLVDWYVGGEGIEETAVDALVSPPKGAYLISSVSDIGGFAHTDLNHSPISGMSQPDYTPNSIDFASSYPWIIVRSPGGSSNQGAVSSDGGTTWTTFTGYGDGSGGANKIAISADGKHWVLTSWGGNQAYSFNSGATWAASAGLPNGDAVISDRVNPWKFYSYDQPTGTVYISVDGGKTFTPAATTAQWGTLFASPAAEGDLWLGNYAGTYESTNSGASFNQIGSAQDVATMGFGKAAAWSNYPTLYMSGEVNNVWGIFRSTDRGTTWLQINDSTHQWGAVNPVIGDPRVFGRVYIGTNGRGIIRGDDNAADAKE